jgi:hypothetical protein
MAHVTVLLGGSLRALHPEARTGEIEIVLDDPVQLDEFLALAEIPEDQAAILMLNHRRALLDTVIQPGDRLAVFPPSLAFNLYVASGFAHGGTREKGPAGAVPGRVSDDDTNPGE